LCGIFSCFEVYESIVAVTTDPDSDNRCILKEANILAHFFKGTVKEFHQFKIAQVQRDIYDI
jgi:hypothetical protein